MSQQKVDRYKEEKRNRDKIMKKEKREWMLTKIGMSVVAIVMVAWIGVSVYDLIESTTASNLPTYTVNTDALDSYLVALQAEEE